LSAEGLGTLAPDQQAAPAAPPHGGSRIRAALVLVLSVVLLVALVVGGYFAYRLANPTDEPFSPFSGSSSVVSDTQRHEAQAVAEQFALRMDNIDGTNFDSYVKKIKQLLTTKAKTDNKQVFSVMGKTYQAAKISGSGKIQLSGVGDINSDSATVLVAHDATVKTPQGELVHHYRWNVDLAKIVGKWLVDSFTPVG
jgi:Mce-associated membrane protein